MAGVYVINIEGSRFPSGVQTRYVVVAEGANEAAGLAAGRFGVPLADIPTDIIEVARLGNFEPSPTGARFYGVIAEQVR